MKIENLKLTKLKDRDVIALHSRCTKAGGRLEKLNQNPGINILELGKTYLYVNSQFSFYYYNLSSINNEYLSC